MRTVRRRLHVMTLGAEAGPSGMRNGHISCLAKVHNGLVALQKWVGMWRNACIQPGSSLLWCASVVVPIDCGPKQDGTRKLRPIALTEHLLKVAESIIIDETMTQLRATFEPRQLGAGTPDGNVLIYRILQSWLHDIEANGINDTCVDGAFTEDSCRRDALLGLDMENAYGRFLRSAAIKGLDARVPDLAKLVLSEWGSMNTAYWQRADGKWRSSATARGGWQGSRLAMVTFCFSLEYSMDLMPAPVKTELTRLGYQDDTYFAGNAFVMAREWDNISWALEAGGHRLNNTKSSVYLPCWVGTPASHFPAELQTWLAGITRSTQGLATMGCAAQGSYESVLGPFQYAVHAASRRLDKASVFHDKLAELVSSCTDDVTLHAAWLLIAKSLNQTLCYDARLLHSDAVGDVMGLLGSMVRGAVERIVGCNFAQDCWEQLQLPGPLGGMGVRLQSASAHAAFLSTWITCKDKIAVCCAKLGRPTATIVGQDAAMASQACLLNMGIAVRLDGEVAFTESAANSYALGPWCKDCPPTSLFSYTARTSNVQVGSGTKVHARIMRGVEALQATYLHSSLSPYRRTVMLSCGGGGAGKFWSTLPGRPDHFMDNLHFRTALCMRLGLIAVPEGAVCQIPTASAAGEGRSECLSSLEPDIQHPFLCKAGPARLRPHRSLAETLAGEVKRLGAHVDLERACPDLYQQHASGHTTEAILDVVYHLPGGPCQRKIDVTIRCPFARRYGSTDAVGGVAAAVGVADKCSRYGPSVICLSFETFGRLDASSCELLQQMASDFENRCSARLPCRRLYERWRASLERALYFEMADIVLLSLGHSSGLHRRRLNGGTVALPGSGAA